MKVVEEKRRKLSTEAWGDGCQGEGNKRKMGVLGRKTRQAQTQSRDPESGAGHNQ